MQLRRLPSSSAIFLLRLKAVDSAVHPIQLSSSLLQAEEVGNRHWIEKVEGAAGLRGAGEEPKPLGVVEEQRPLKEGEELRYLAVAEAEVLPWFYFRASTPLQKRGRKRRGIGRVAVYSTGLNCLADFVYSTPVFVTGGRKRTQGTYIRQIHLSLEGSSEDVCHTASSNLRVSLISRANVCQDLR